MQGVEVAIAGDDGGFCPADGIGEVVIRGGNVMTGYLRRQEDTAAVLVDGWLRKGDPGHLAREAWLTLVGSTTELVIRGGGNMYTSDVEAATPATTLARE